MLACKPSLTFPNWRSSLTIPCELILPGCICDWLSVAIHVNADILLIDDILGVGDVNFQQKCFQRLQEIKAAGTTIVIVSHAMEQIEQICDRSILD